MSPCVAFLRGVAWGSSSFFHHLNPRWFLQPKVVGTYIPGTGILGWKGPSVDLGLLAPEISLPNFYPCGCGISLFHVWAAPTSLGGCGFFNSIVVRLQFSSISDIHEWWWFYILVVILMWLCEGREPYLPTPPSWLEVAKYLVLNFNLKDLERWSKRWSNSLNWPKFYR